MKVLLIHDKELGSPESGVPQAGGIAVYINNLVRGLKNTGNSVAILNLNNSPAHRNIKPSALPAGQYHLPASCFDYGHAKTRELEKIVERENPDIIHLHSANYALSPRMLDRMARLRPLIATFHDVTPVCFRHTRLLPDGRLCSRKLDFACVTSGCHKIGNNTSLAWDAARVLTHPFHQAAFRRIPLILTPSRYLKNLLAINGYSENRIRVLPNFSRFPIPDSSPARPDGPYRILFVGRLIREKGIMHFLEALTRLPHTAWEAVVTGNGPLREEAGAFVSARGLGSKVRFNGETGAADLPALYAAADLVVVPSLVPESFGMVGVEAMTFGKPVVAYRSGGIVDWLQHGLTGLIADHGDTEGLAHNIGRLLSDPAAGIQMGIAGREAVKTHFTLEAHINQIQEIYAEQARPGVSR